MRSSTPIGGMPAGRLLVADLAIAAAVDDDDRYRKPLLDKRCQFLHGEHQRAVAEQHGDRCAGSADRRAEPGGQAVAEGGEARACSRTAAARARRRSARSRSR